MAVTLAAKRLRPKTYSLAIYVVGAIFLAQFAAVLSVFWFRHQVKIDIHAPALVRAPLPMPLAPIDIGPSKQDPSNLPVSPGPARLNVPYSQDNFQRIASLNEEAGKFRQQGEFKLAESALKEAEQLDPQNVITLSSIASLAEAQKDSARARFYWQKIVDQGNPSSSAYLLAKNRLAALDILEKQAEASNAAPVKTTPAAKPGSVLFVSDFQKSEVENSTASREMNFKVAINTSPNAPKIEAGQVAVKFYFYDRLSTGEIVPTTARLTVAFEGSRQTWQNQNREVLNANYFLPPSEAATGHQYYGYLLRIYYQGRLQDERAEPSQLLTTFPAPRVFE